MKAILLAFYGGARYGIKIRLPHSCITTLLFRSNLSLHQKLLIIYKTTLEHSISLAKFAALYKTLLCLMKYTSKIMYLYNKNNGEDGGPGLPYHTHHAFLAGLIGGYTIWGNYSPIHNQILLYLIPRVLMGTSKLFKDNYISNKAILDVSSFSNVYPMTSSLVWAIVMTLFERYPNMLQSSLRSSMYEIYRFSF